MKQEQATVSIHPMKQIRVEKLTLNIGAGKDTQLLNKGVKLLHDLTGIPPIKTITTKRIPAWSLRPGLPIGCKITIRGKKAEEFIPRLLSAKEHMLAERNYDEAGNISFGIPEYIDIEGAKYNPEIGIIGLQACITLTRPGYRVKKRRSRPATIAKQHVISKEEAMGYMADRFSVKAGEYERNNRR
jgi:large subunit ribosomal protein L5